MSTAVQASEMDAQAAPLGPSAVRRVATAAREAALRRDLAEQVTRVEQLQTALDSRVAIDRAVGILAERYRTDVTSAFELMRRMSRDRNVRIRDIAEAVVAGVGSQNGRPL
jgi:AmiR/NasT family two-component response regulator